MISKTHLLWMYFTLLDIYIYMNVSSTGYKIIKFACKINRCYWVNIQEQHLLVYRKIVYHNDSENSRGLEGLRMCRRTRKVLYFHEYKTYLFLFLVGIMYNAYHVLNDLDSTKHMDHPHINPEQAIFPPHLMGKYTGLLLVI